jgi:2-oxoglutarate ferredoxin oxidoreductase subunit beta
MTCIQDFTGHDPQWCPGCGNFDLLDCVKQALCELNVEPQRVIFAAGIGQASKLGFSVRANLFNGLHGRALPVALGLKMANHTAPVLAVSGDGCFYAEGGNHFIHAVRRNLNIAILASDNRVYGLTKGQASPTSPPDFASRANPEGVGAQPLNPALLALVCGATFVARTFTGSKAEVVDLVKRAMQHRGTSFLDIMSPCVSFNKVNTFAWYKKRVRPLGPEHDPANREAAIKLALAADEETIPTGVYYQVERPVFEDHLGALRGAPIAERTLGYKPERVRPLFERFM